MISKIKNMNSIQLNDIKWSQRVAIGVQIDIWIDWLGM